MVVGGMVVGAEVKVVGAGMAVRAGPSADEGAHPGPNRAMDTTASGAKRQTVTRRVLVSGSFTVSAYRAKGPELAFRGAGAVCSEIEKERGKPVTGPADELGAAVPLFAIVEDLPPFGSA